MKKILLYMALVGSLFGSDLNINSYRSDSNSLSVIVENMENCYTNAECDFQVFIDTDNNSDTGFYGADYRISGYDGEIHASKHTSEDIEAWEWEVEDDLLNFNNTVIDDNDIYIEFSDSGISVLNQENNKFEAIISSYINYDWVKEEDIKVGVFDHDGEYHTFENGGNEPEPNNATVLSADGDSDNTYNLINNVLGDGNENHDRGKAAYEVPDECNENTNQENEHHTPHITQLWNDDLQSYVFAFHIHVNEDTDRCIDSGKQKYKQRTEIKVYDKSDDNLWGGYNNTFIYKWKFKLPDDFKVSNKFTHLHQLKAKGDNSQDEVKFPLITLTARTKSGQDYLEVRYPAPAESDKNFVVLSSNLLGNFKGVWVEVTEKVHYSENGSYSIEINNISTGNILLSYENDNIRTWRTGAEFMRPKWGIYRQYKDKEDGTILDHLIRDEEVLFNEFSIEKL